MMKTFILFLSVSGLFFSSLANLSADSDIRFYVFTDPHCGACERKMRPLIYAYDRDKIIVYDVRQRNYGGRFSNMSNIIEVHSIPLVGVFRDGNLTAMAVAAEYFSEEDWVKIVETESDGVPIYVRDTTNPAKVISESDARKLITELFLGNGSPGPQTSQSVIYLIPLILVAAVADAVNPCEFYVLTVLLSFVFFRVGRKTVLKAGIAYSVAVFIIYYLMGFGLLRIIGFVEEARVLVVILGFAVGLRAVLNFLFGVLGLSLGLRDTIGTFLDKKFKRVPEFFSKKLSSYLARFSENPYGAFAIGIVASAFLLPCTSGPYLIALSLISRLETLLEGLFLLAVYNGIIITPFLAITLGIYMLKVKTGELKRWSSRKQKSLNLVAGLLMIVLSLYLMSSIVT